MSEHCVLYVTTPSEEIAAKIANALVGEELAACVNRVPGVRSTYKWEKAIHHDDELLLIIKTRTALFEQVQQRVCELHPYSTPEIIALPIIAGHAPYLAWIDETTRKLG